jgi:multidrug efflux system membrane fusion protein
MNEPIQPQLREPFSSSRADDRAATRRGWPWGWTIAVLLVAALAYWLYRHFTAPAPAPAAQGAASAQKSKRGGGAPGSTGPTPVVAANAREGDIDVYLDGLGTVTPVRTVTVKSRVDGELVQVLFREGQIVKAGELLAQIDPRPYQVALTQMEGMLARDEALLGNARLDLQRYTTLFAQDSVAKQQLDTQQSLVQQYVGTVEMDKGQVDNARLQLDYSHVTAPVGGRIGLRQVDQGNIVHASDTTGLAVITQLQPIDAVFTVPQDSLPSVLQQYLGGKRLPVDAYDREFKNKLASGALLSPDNQVDTTTGTVKMKAEFLNEQNILFPNQFVNTRMKVDTLHGQTLIPSAAVQRGSQGLFVYVIKPDHTVTVRTVTLKLTEGDTMAVKDGVSPGEQIVVDGMDRLREGAPVTLGTRSGGNGAASAGKGGARAGKGGDGSSSGKGGPGGAPAAGGA